MSKTFEQAIKDGLSELHYDCGIDFTYFQALNSTNAWLLENIGADSVSHAVCVAGQQLRGRGRQDRSWESPASGNIYMSLSYELPVGLVDFSSLSLVIGVVVINALTALGINDLGLKWPNDVMHQGEKVAGILIEVKQLKAKRILVIGVGINIETPIMAGNKKWHDLSAYRITTKQRAEIVVNIVQSTYQALNNFAEKGFKVFQVAWQNLDIWYQQDVVVTDQKKVLLTGVNMGVSERGLLRVKTPTGVVEIHSGDVSLRRLG